MGRRKPRAVTTLELITILIIIMILAVIGFSGFRIFQHRQPPRGAAARLSNSLSTARTFAISQNTFYRVLLDLDNKNFWIDEIPNPNDASSGQFVPKVVPPEAFDMRVVIEGVQQTGQATLVTTGRQSFIFRPDGSASRDARIFFHAPQDDPADPTNIYTVRIYAPTGHNELFERQRI